MAKYIEIKLSSITPITIGSTTYTTLKVVQAKDVPAYLNTLDSLYAQAKKRAPSIISTIVKGADSKVIVGSTSKKYQYIIASLDMTKIVEVASRSSKTSSICGIAFSKTPKSINTEMIDCPYVSNLQIAFSSSRTIRISQTNASQNWYPVMISDWNPTKKASESTDQFINALANEAGNKGYTTIGTTPVKIKEDLDALVNRIIGLSNDYSKCQSEEAARAIFDVIKKNIENYGR